MQKKIDYPKLNASIIGLDAAILASSFVSKHDGVLLARSVKHGLENKLGIDGETEHNWGTWAAVITGVAEQADKVLSNVEYIAVGRKDFKGVIIPFDSLDLIVRLTVEKKTESTYIVDKVREFLNHSLA